ncbi:MAG TPA: hypothetical protein PK122_00925 [Candidatus Paceibacterota bacterium]|nr:hypothetical protein [Candidatus Paceibacterota bacterium]
MEDTGRPLKPVHFHLFKPHNSIFKSTRKDRAQVQLVMCSRSDECDLFKRGQCSFTSSFGWHACPYGTYRKYEGFTPRARAYSEWIRKEEEKYKGTPYLNSHSDVLAFIGDYVFLPYAHMDMADVGWIQKNTGWFGKGCAFLKKELFTPQTVLQLIDFRPQAMMGGEIKDYQEKTIPKFVKHLQEKCPDLLKEVEKLEIKRALDLGRKNGEEQENKFFRSRVRKILEEYSYIGRKAILETLNPNVGQFTDIHKGNWIWDGSYLISLNSKASFMLVDKFEEIRIKPKPGSVVVITDNAQVNEKTEFLS